MIIYIFENNVDNLTFYKKKPLDILIKNRIENKIRNKKLIANESDLIQFC
jgi:hypothetical protein